MFSVIELYNIVCDISHTASIGDKNKEVVDMTKLLHGWVIIFEAISSVVL